MARQIVVDIVGDSKSFGTATDGAITKATSLTGKLQGIGKGMVLGAGMGAFNLLSGAVDTAISKLGECAAAYREDQAGQVMLAAALKNNIPNWDGNAKGAEAFAGAQGRLGFADDDVRASLQQLVGATHDLTEAQNLTALAEDLARAKGIDLATATDIVTKAHAGNGKALKGLGIDITGVKDAAGFLDAMQKNVNGSAETWAGTNDGKLAVSNVKVGEAMEKVGEVVDKVTSVVIPLFADALTTVIDFLGQVWDAMQPGIQIVIPKLQAAFDAIKPIVEAVFGAIKTAVGIAVSYLSVEFQIISNILGVAGNVFKVLSSVVGTVFNSISGAVNTIVGVFGKITTTVNEVKTNVTNAFNNLVNLITGLPGRMAGALGNLFTPIWGGFKSAINSIIRGWNSLHFTMPSIDLGPLGRVGGFTIGTPNLPYLHSGGIVPGLPGQDVLAILQAGERVIPTATANKSQATNNIVNINIENFTGSNSDIDRLADKIAFRLRLAGA